MLDLLKTFFSEIPGFLVDLAAHLFAAFILVIVISFFFGLPVLLVMMAAQ